MKFAFTVACLFGLAVAGPVLFSEPLEKRCKGLQDHCSKDDECCSVSLYKSYPYI